MAKSKFLCKQMKFQEFPGLSRPGVKTLNFYEHIMQYIKLNGAIEQVARTPIMENIQARTQDFVTGGYKIIFEGGVVGVVL